MTRLDDAISHLACALGQALPSDDQIIVGHVRDALALLRSERAMRNAAKTAAHECRDCSDTLPTGDAEPCSGLCAECDAAEGEKQAYLDAVDDARWSARERADERREG